MCWYEIVIELIVWWWDVVFGSWIRLNIKIDLFVLLEVLMIVVLMGCGRCVI